MHDQLTFSRHSTFTINDLALNLVINNYDELIVMRHRPNVNSVCTGFGSMFNSE